MKKHKIIISAALIICAVSALFVICDSHKVQQLAEITDITKTPRAWYLEGIHEGMIACRENSTPGSNLGYVDKQGKLAIPHIYTDGGRFQSGLAPVKKNGKYAYINRSGETIIPFVFDEARDFDEAGLAAVCSGDLWYFIDEKGATADFDYQYINQSEEIKYSEGFAIAFDGKRYGFVDANGEQTIPCLYDEVELMHDRLAAVQVNGRYFYIDTQGDDAFPDVSFQSISSYSDGLARVTINNKEVFINTDGEITLECNLEDVLQYGAPCEGLIPFRSERTRNWGYMDYYGGVIIPPILQEAGMFSDGAAVVECGNKQLIIENPLL